MFLSPTPSISLPFHLFPHSLSSHLHRRLAHFLSHTPYPIQSSLHRSLTHVSLSLTFHLSLPSHLSARSLSLSISTVGSLSLSLLLLLLHSASLTPSLPTSTSAPSFLPLSLIPSLSFMLISTFSTAPPSHAHFHLLRCFPPSTSTFTSPSLSFTSPLFSLSSLLPPLLPSLLCSFPPPPLLPSLPHCSLLSYAHFHLHHCSPLFPSIPSLSAAPPSSPPPLLSLNSCCSSLNLQHPSPLSPHPNLLSLSLSHLPLYLMLIYTPSAVLHALHCPCQFLRCCSFFLPLVVPLAAISLTPLLLIIVNYSGGKERYMEDRVLWRRMAREGWEGGGEEGDNVDDGDERRGCAW